MFCEIVVAELQDKKLNRKYIYLILLLISVKV